MDTTTTTAADITMSAAPLAVSADTDRPAYRYAGDGRWFPSNQEALDECAAWNRWADTINARTAAARSAVQ